MTTLDLRFTAPIALFLIFILVLMSIYMFKYSVMIGKTNKFHPYPTLAISWLCLAFAVIILTSSASSKPRASLFSSFNKQESKDKLNDFVVYAYLFVPTISLLVFLRKSEITASRRYSIAALPLITGLVAYTLSGMCAKRSSPRTSMSDTPRTNVVQTIKDHG